MPLPNTQQNLVQLVLSVPGPAPKLSLGSFIASSPTTVARQVLADNRTPNPLRVRFSLSESLRHIISLTRPNPESSATKTKSHLANLNLLHRSEPFEPTVLLSPLGTTLVSLHFAASASAAATFFAPTDHVPLAGHIHALDTHGTCLSSIPLETLLCHSRFRPDPLRLDYGHCPLSSWIYRDLRIINLAPVPTAFCISVGSAATSDSPNSTCFKFLDAATSAALDPSSIQLPAGRDRLIKVGLLLEAAGEEVRWFTLENIHNPMNLSHISVIATLRADRVARSIEVDCGSELDFGDCHARCRMFRDVTLRNKCDEDLNVALLSDRRHQISYELLQEWAVEREDTFETQFSSAGDTPASFADVANFHRVRDIADTPLSQAVRGQGGGTKATAAEVSHVLEGTAGQPVQPQFVSLTSKMPTSVEQLKQSCHGSRGKAAEYVSLAPGHTRVIRVWYLPLLHNTEPGLTGSSKSDLDRGRMRVDRLRLFFRLPSGESRVTEARSRVCESILRLGRSEVHLGDCNVLSRYKCTLGIINCSDLPASVTISYVSQCVVADVHEISIMPREAFDLLFHFTPRQVNPNYHKEITISNRMSPHDPNSRFTLRANCVDRQGISLHALFYKILAPIPTNEIDFGTTVANHPAIRAFRVRNTTKRKLTLKFNAGPGIRTYIPSDVGAASSLPLPHTAVHDVSQKGVAKFLSHCNQNSAIDDPHRTIDALIDERQVVLYKGLLSNRNSQACDLHTEELNHKQSLPFLPETGSRMDYTDFDESGECFALGGERSWVEFLKCLDERDFALLDSIPMFFSNHDAEMRYTERQFRPARRLQAALRDGYLLESNILNLEADAELLVVVSLVLTDAEVRGKTKTRPFEKKLMVEILEFDDTVLSDAAASSSREFLDIAKRFEDDHVSLPREIMLTVQACKSKMRIAPLRQLNFGTIRCGEQKDKAFTIVNLSEAPLLYELRKGGTECDDELRFNLGKGTLGVVRPYFSKIVPFIYAPTSQGGFEERIIVENRLDNSANCELVVKAVVQPAMS